MRHFVVQCWVVMGVLLVGCSQPPPNMGTTVTVTGSVGVPGADVCADLNGNGACDDGEPKTKADATGAYSLTLLQNEKDTPIIAFAEKAGTVPTNHRNAVISVCLDVNENHTCDAMEPSTTADATGHYSMVVNVAVFGRPVVALATLKLTLPGAHPAGTQVCLDSNANQACDTGELSTSTDAANAWQLVVDAARADDALIFRLLGSWPNPAGHTVAAACLDRNADHQCSAADLSLTPRVESILTVDQWVPIDVADLPVLLQLTGSIAGQPANTVVCFDIDDNGRCDVSDPSTTTSAAGDWSLTLRTTTLQHAVLFVRTGVLPGHAGETLCLDTNQDTTCSGTETSSTIDASGRWALAMTVAQSNVQITVMRTGLVPNISRGTVTTLCIDVNGDTACTSADLPMTADATTGAWTRGTALADADKPVIARLRLTGTAGTSGAGGTVCLDLDANTTCDAAEPTTTTSAQNTYTLEVAAAQAGSTLLYALRGSYVAPANATVTSLCVDTDATPVDRCTATDVDLLAGYNPSTGAYAKTITVAQSLSPVLVLLSKTGVLATAPNATVCIDNDTNGACDSGEPSTTTDSAGAYTFTQLKPNQLNGSLVVTVLLSFTRTDVTSALPGVVLKASDFSVTVAQTAGLTCELDANGDGVYDFWATNCTGLSARYEYYSSGTYTPSVRITGPGGTTSRSLPPFTIAPDPVLPDRNRTAWDTVGTTLPTAEPTCAQTVGAPTGTDSTAIQSAINTAATAYAALVNKTGVACYVTLGAGTYTLNAQIFLKAGVILAGQGASTIVTSNFTTSALIGNITGGSSQVSQMDSTAPATFISAQKGRNWVDVPATFATTVQGLLTTNGSLFGSLATENEFCHPSATPSDQGEARLPPTASSPPSSNACFVSYPQATFADSQLGYEDATRRRPNYSIGQTFRVIRVQGTKLVLDRPINDEYPATLNGLNYKLTVSTPAAYTEKLGVTRMIIAPQNDQLNNVISLNRTSHAVIQQIEIRNHYRRAIGFGDSLDCEVRGNYIHDPNNRKDTGGGLGYGIAMESYTNGCRIIDNILYNNRHGILLQYGANGNVVAENYLDRDNGENCAVILGQTICVPIATAGLSIHGMYPHMNLIEGNSVDTQLQAADYHGPSKFSTFFKNAITGSNIGVSRAARYNALIDNQVFGSGTGITVDSATIADKITCVANVVMPGGTPATVTGSTACNNQAQFAARPNSWWRVRATPIDPSAIAAKTRAASAPIW